jgi:hypothetical protein
MYELIPMCRICGEYEVMTFPGGTIDFCSAKCADEAHEMILDALSDSRTYRELTDCCLAALADAEALASAGYGTDEDYGYYGEDV